MSILKNTLYEHEHNLDNIDEKDAKTTVDGEPVDLGESQTVQTYDETFFASGSKYGIPLGSERYEAREIGQTWAMEIIKNAIYDQIGGGERAYEPTGTRRGGR